MLLLPLSEEVRAGRRKKIDFFIKKNRYESMSDFCKKKVVCISWLEEEKVLSAICGENIIFGNSDSKLQDK